MIRGAKVSEPRCQYAVLKTVARDGRVSDASCQYAGVKKNRGKRCGGAQAEMPISHYYETVFGDVRVSETRCHSPVLKEP